MKKIELDDLKLKVEADLKLEAVSATAILTRFRMIDEDSRKSASYMDPAYFPFYYHLGKYVEPVTMLEIGFTLGLPSASFLLSCKTVNKFLGFKEVSKEYSNHRIGKSNMKQVYREEAIYYEGNLYDDKFSDIFSPNSLDLTILNNKITYDKHLECLDSVWPQVSENGLIIAEFLDQHFPAKEAFFAFCESKNRKPVMFKTRYGTAILQK